VTSERPDLFREKAADYARFRVDYPEDLIEGIWRSSRIVPTDVIADIGSGTGMLSRWFLMSSRLTGSEKALFVSMRDHWEQTELQMQPRE
jgi:hypothetical protein